MASSSSTMTTRSKTTFIGNSGKILQTRYITRSVTKRYLESKTAEKAIELGEKPIIVLQKAFKVKPCGVKDCVDPSTHIDFNHSCLYCSEEADEHLRCCPLNAVKTAENRIYDDISQFTHYKDEMAHMNKITRQLKKAEFMCVPSLQGGRWYIRNNNGHKQYLFMDADNWGQYGPHTSHFPRYRAFVHGYTKKK
jgi:hypothetical protein